VRPRLAGLAGVVGLLVAAAGPYDIALHPTQAAPRAQGRARLVPTGSPFGVDVTADGHASYNVAVTTSGLPSPGRLGKFSAYVAWAVVPDLSRWQRLGPVRNGTFTVGPVELNKFLLVITAEPDSAPAAHAGPTVLHGTSPSGWLQSFITHPLFRGVTQ
jgi:hypothetical protein